MSLTTSPDVTVKSTTVATCVGTKTYTGFGRHLKQGRNRQMQRVLPPGMRPRRNEKPPRIVGPSMPNEETAV